MQALTRSVHERAPLPETSWPRPDHSASRAELAKVMAECDRSHPIGRYVHDSAKSVISAAAMTESVGTPEFATHNHDLYGSPGDDLVPGQRGSTLNAAKQLLHRTESVGASCSHDEADYCVVAESVADQIRRVADEVFGAGRIEVAVDATLSSKAAASSNRVRLRGGTCFSSLDGPQLVQHELLVHTLTAANGREQQTLASLGQGLPRTTRTQEGLAVFAEFISGTMDVARLRRIAARVVGIAMALEGADFVEVAGFFLESGQTEREAVQSAARVFRGTDAKGGVAFSKDAVYLQGFVRVHAFLRAAIEDDDFERAYRLFAGRLTTGDCRRLAPAFDAGVIAPPARVPPWMKNRATLGAFLVYDAFAREMHLGDRPIVD